MATSNNFPQRVPYSTDAQPVKFAPVQDSETGDDMLEPPFVRVRDGNTAFMYIDTSRETQFGGGTNSAQWIVGQAGPQSNSQIDARKIRRQACVAVKYAWFTPNVNPTNNVITFRVSTHPLVDLTAVIPTYNYMRMFTSPATPLVTGPPVVVTPVPVTLGYGNEVDPEDGILSKLITAMNNASIAIGSVVRFTAVPSDGYRDLTPSNYNNSNCFFYRIGAVNGTFILTGGSVFAKGSYLLGLAPIIPVDFGDLANYYAVYAGGPVTFIYTRWLDITSRTLLQNAKMPLSGTDVPSNLLLRIYMSKEEQMHGTRLIKLEAPAQWINWVRSQAINSVDVQLRDEFGELVELPQRQNNSTWVSLIMLNEL